MRRITELDRHRIEVFRRIIRYVYSHIVIWINFLLSLSGDRSLLHHSSKSNTKEVEASRRYSAEVDREKGQTNSARPSESSLLVSRPSSRLRTWYQLVFRPLTADYTRSEVVRLGLLLSPIWLFSNLLYNYSLLLTSISSSTIIR